MSSIESIKEFLPGAFEGAVATTEALLGQINDAFDMLGSYAGLSDVDDALADVQAATADYLHNLVVELGEIEEKLCELHELMEKEGEEL